MTYALPPRASSWKRNLAWGAALVVFLVATSTLSIDLAALASLPGELLRYAYLMFASPDWSRLGEAIFQTWRSITMAWVGALLGVSIATVLGVAAARTVGPVWLRLPLRGLFALIRAVPEVIIAIIILTVTGLTPFTGALALAIGGVGTHAKWTYEAVESVPQGPSEAVRASGGSLFQVIRWGVFPLVTPELLSLALYRFEINVRTSAILGLIGVGGIGDMLSGYTQYRQWSTVGMLLIVVVVVTMTIDAVSGRIRRRITGNAPDRGKRRPSELVGTN